MCDEFVGDGLLVVMDGIIEGWVVLVGDIGVGVVIEEFL